MSKPTWPVLPGGLSAADHEKIFEMHERGLASSAIAPNIRKHPATVNFFMYRQGLKARVIRNPRQPYRRGNSIVRQFAPAEDAYLQEQRIAGRRLTDIASAMAERFGHPRSRHSLFLRLTVLASFEAAAAERMEAAE